MNITRRPEKTTEGRPVTWQAVHSPVVYEVSTTIAGTYFQVEIYEPHSGSADVLLGSLISTPVKYSGTERRAKINVSPYLQQYLKHQDDFSYLIKNGVDLLNSVRYYIIIKEFLNDIQQGVDLDDSTNQYTAINAVRQAGEPAEMDVYEMVNATNDGKFLTEFDEPVYFRGYPFSLSWIYSDDLDGLSIRVNESQYSGKNQVNNLQSIVDNNTIMRTNRLMIEEPTDGVNRVCLTLETGDAVPPSYVYPGYVEDDYV